MNDTALLALGLTLLLLTGVAIGWVLRSLFIPARRPEKHHDY